jgi:hypothetical protein
MSGSFFVLDGFNPTTAQTFQQLVDDAIQASGAIGPKSVTVVNPTGSENLTLFFVNAPVTVQQLTMSVKGSAPSITVDIQYSSSPEGAGTSIVTGGTVVTGASEVTSFNNATIPANSYVRLVTSAKSGDVTELAISIDF